MKTLYWRVLLVAVFLAAGACWSQAEEKAVTLPMVPFHYAQDFEQGPSPVIHWTTSIPGYTVNFMDVTEEKSFSGKKSFKLDVTLPGGCSSYWGIPVNIPLEGNNLKFRGKILFLQGDKATAGFGFDALFPKSWLSGCAPFSTFQPSDKWQDVSSDFGVADTWFKDYFPKLVWGLSRDDVGTVVNILGLFIFASGSTRVVVYLDDIDVSGTVPEATAYGNEVVRRWTLYQNGPFKQAVDGFTSRIAAVTKDVGQDEKTKSAINEKATQATAKVAEIQKKGWLSTDECNAVNKLLLDAEQTLTSAKTEGLFK